MVWRLPKRAARGLAAVLAVASVGSVLVACSGSKQAHETGSGTPESVAAGGPLDAVIDGVRADGTYPTSVALERFALSYGPIPGASVDHGDREVPDVSGTEAIAAVFSVWSQLDDAQRRAIRARLDLPADFEPPATGEGTDAGAPSTAAPGHGLRVTTPTDTAGGRAWRPALDDSLRPLEAHLGPLTVPTYIVTQHHDTGASTEDGVAIADTLVINGACRIRIYTSRWGGIANRAAQPLAHELFHCYQQTTNPQWWREPAWILEGSADWVGQAAVLDAGARVDNTAGEEHLSSYLARSQRGLFSRSYDAIGFYLHASARGRDLWPIVLPLQTASNDAGWTLIVPGFGDQLTTVPSAMFWSEAQGPYWIDRWQGIPHVPAAPVRHEAVGNSESTAMLSGAAAVSTRVVDLRADITTISVPADTFGYAYVDLTTRAIGELVGEWCTTPGHCTCPEGTRRAGHTFTSLAGGATPMAISAGRFPGRAEIRGQSLEDACEREIACPVGTWQMRQRPSGLPYEIESGGTGTLLTVDAAGNVTEDFGPFVEQTARFSGDPEGFYRAKVEGILRGHVALPSGRERFTSADVTDVDGSGLGGHGTAEHNGEVVLTLGPDDVRQLAAIGPEFGTVTMSCGTPGVLTLSGGGITQTFEKVD